MPFLEWTTGRDHDFLPFETANLSTAPPMGVYVILVIGSINALTVKVGLGNIENLIAADREDQEILAFRQTGKVQVTWAGTTREQMSGIARYLSDVLNPIIATSVGISIPPIKANVPGSNIVPDGR